MKIFPSIFHVSLYCLISTALPISAQDIEKAAKQVPTSKEGIKNAAETAKKAVVAPLPKSATLDLLRQRSKALMASQNQYHEALANGKFQPNAHLESLRPQQLLTIAEIKKNIALFNSTNVPSEREKLKSSIFTLLQPIGFHLSFADYSDDAENVISNEQVNTLEGLNASWYAKPTAPAKELTEADTPVL